MKKTLLIAAVTLLFLLAGCSQGSTPAPQVDANSLNTAVAATVEAALASTLAAPAEAVEPATPAPSATPEAEIAATSEESIEIPAEPATDLRVVYSDGQGDLWFLQGGAAPLLLVDSSDVADFALSPDGGQVFFSRMNNYTDFSLWLIDTDGSNERLVMSVDDFEAMPRPAQSTGTAPVQLGWVPNSATAVFTTYYYYDGPGVATGDDLYLVNGATGTVNTLLEPGQGGGRFFYSPDGEQIALVQPNQINLIDSDGSHRRDAVLSFEDIFTYTEAPFYAQPLWSADGATLRLIVPAKDRLGAPDDPSSVWEVPTAGGEAVRLLQFYPRGLSASELSPDGKWLAYLETSTTGGQSALHIVRLEDASDVVYASGSLNWTGWTEDSQGFIWTKYGEVGSARQTFLGELGAEPVLLGAPQTPHILSWVADDQFLFLENVGGTPPAWKLYLGTLGGSNQLLADLAAGDRTPSFKFIE